MKSKDITITSKNQLTLPAEFVRSMHLDRNRVLHAELRGGSIVLTPQPKLDYTDCLLFALGDKEGVVTFDKDVQKLLPR